MNGPKLAPFLGEQTARDSSSVTILPVPFERTTSYGGGTERGPAAILAASHHVELWDEELRFEPSEVGIHTAAPWACDGATPIEEALAAIEARAAALHRDGDHLLVSLGGEHSITAPLVGAARAHAGEPIGVVQFDAHSDLRDIYDGTPHSHACVMRRVLEGGSPTLAVGIRSLSAPEAARIDAEGLDVVWGHELAEHGPTPFLDRLAALPDPVYLTFDVDYLDPALVPATGTPEPGGGTWYPTLTMLRRLFETKRVVAMDVVELAPIPGHHASDFLVAKLIYKCIGYWAAARRASTGLIG